MNPETNYLKEMRMRAGSHLTPGFATSVMRDAQARRRRSQRNRLAAMTGALCVALVIAVHWMMTAQTNRKNLEMWSKAARQITVLEETI